MIQRVFRARRLTGEIAVPSDKSLTHRAVMFSALAKGTSVIHNPLPAADCLSTASCMKAPRRGPSVPPSGNRWTVEGKRPVGIPEALRRAGLRQFRNHDASGEWHSRGAAVRDDVVRRRFAQLPPDGPRRGTAAHDGRRDRAGRGQARADENFWAKGSASRFNGPASSRALR